MKTPYKSKPRKNSESSSEEEVKPQQIKPEEKKENIPNFDEIPVNTITAIVSVNINMDIQAILSQLPVVDYKPIPKKRGRKKKDEIPYELVPNLLNGSIITIEPSDSNQSMRGSRIKKRKEKPGDSDNSKPDYFRNALTVVMVMDKKFINFKISKNGFQFTGCKNDRQAIECVKVVWQQIENTGMYTFIENDEIDDGSVGQKSNRTLQCVLVPAMRNINFYIGYNIDREKLNTYINANTKYKSLFDSTTGYTGVNIKIPHKNSISELNLEKFVYDNKTRSWKEPERITYNDYLSSVSAKERAKKLLKTRDHTFLVFHSGKVIMSSLCASLARDVYYEFMDLLINNSELFQEQLNETGSEDEVEV